MDFSELSGILVKLGLASLSGAMIGFEKPGYSVLGFISTFFAVLTIYGVRYVETITGAKYPRLSTLILIDSGLISNRVNEVEYRADIHISPVMEEELMNILSEDESILSYQVTKTL